MAEQNLIRLSSFADLREVKSAIKTAPVLATGDGPVTKVAVGNVKLPQITAEDCIDSVVIKFIRENPNLNEDEIVGALNPILQMPDKITAALAQLYRAGLVIQTPVLQDGGTISVYRAKANALARRLKEQNEGEPAHKPFKLPEVAIVDPAGIIIFEQGIDIAIWKIMQDHEWRSLEDIALLLYTYGFQAYAVKSRVKTLHELGTGGIRWFDTTRKNKLRRRNPEPYYKLRLGVVCPKVGALSMSSIESLPSEPQELSGEQAVQAILSGNSVFSVPAVASESVADAQPKESAVEYDTEVRQGDHFPVVLWKVLIGKKAVPVREMARLVEPYGFNEVMCASIMKQWVQAGYLNRDEAKGEGDRRVVNVYTLRELPMPAFRTNSRSKFAELPGATPAAQRTDEPKETTLIPEVPAAADKAQPHQDPGPLFSQQAPTEVATPAAKPAVNACAPLVRHLVVIKGVEFTLAELDQIIAEMNALKLFAWVAMPNRVVKAQFEIKGVQLTPEELNEVLQSMK